VTTFSNHTLSLHADSYFFFCLLTVAISHRELTSVFNLALFVKFRYTPILLGLLLRVRVRVTLRLAVYCQSVRLGTNPLKLTARTFFN
jgi:hypothetical protein